MAQEAALVQEHTCEKRGEEQNDLIGCGGDLSGQESIKQGNQ